MDTVCDLSLVCEGVGRVRVFPVAVRSAVPVSESDLSPVRDGVGCVRVFPVAVRSDEMETVPVLSAEIERVRLEADFDGVPVWSGVSDGDEVRSAEMVRVLLERVMVAVWSAVPERDCDLSAESEGVGRVRVFPVAVWSAVPVSERDLSLVCEGVGCVRELPVSVRSGVPETDCDLSTEWECVCFDTVRETDAERSAVPVMEAVRMELMVGVFLVGERDAEWSGVPDSLIEWSAEMDGVGRVRVFAVAV